MADRGHRRFELRLWGRSTTFGRNYSIRVDYFARQAAGLFFELVIDTELYKYKPIDELLDR